MKTFKEFLTHRFKRFVNRNDVNEESFGLVTTNSNANGTSKIYPFLVYQRYGESTRNNLWDKNFQCKDWGINCYKHFARNAPILDGDKLYDFKLSDYFSLVQIFEKLNIKYDMKDDKFKYCPPTKTNS